MSDWVWNGPYEILNLATGASLTYLYNDGDSTYDQNQPNRFSVRWSHSWGQMTKSQTLFTGLTEEEASDRLLLLGKRLDAKNVNLI